MNNIKEKQKKTQHIYFMKASFAILASLLKTVVETELLFVSQHLEPDRLSVRN